MTPAIAERRRKKPEIASVEYQTKEEPKPIWVRPKAAAKLGGFGLTRCYELIADGQLETRKVGGMRLVKVASIEALGAASAE